MRHPNISVLSHSSTLMAANSVLDKIYDSAKISSRAAIAGSSRKRPASLELLRVYRYSQRRIDSARLLQGSISIQRFLTLILLNRKAIRFSSKLHHSNALELLLNLLDFHALYNYDCKIVIIAFILKSQDAKTHYRPGVGSASTRVQLQNIMSVTAMYRISNT